MNFTDNYPVLNSIAVTFVLDYLLIQLFQLTLSDKSLKLKDILKEPDTSTTW